MRSRLMSACLGALVALGLSACASRGATPRLPGSIGSPSAGRSAAAIVDLALQFQGTPYRNGGEDVSGFDCSGLVQYVFASQGVAMPRSVREQYGAGAPVSPGDLQPGDLVFFSTVSRGPSHVGILVRDEWFVHAPSDGGVVRLDRLSGEYWARRYVGARRVTVGQVR